MRIVLDPDRIEDYRKFLAIKSLPVFRIRGREAWFPDEYAWRIGGESPKTGRRIELPRRFYGTELKPEYHATALNNLARAVSQRSSNQSQFQFSEAT